MNPAEVVMGDVQRDRRDVVVQLLREAVGQAGEPARPHAQGKVLPLDIAGLKLIASGEVDETMLEALEDYVKRQKRRIERQSVAERDKGLFG